MTRQEMINELDILAGKLINGNPDEQRVAVCLLTISGTVDSGQLRELGEIMSELAKKFLADLDAKVSKVTTHQ